MPDAPPPPPPIKFPVARSPGGGAAPLSLRRRPLAVSEASAAARESIKAIVSATRSPFPGGPPPATSQVAELEKSLRMIELALAERERAVAEAEARLADREREVAEGEALLLAREKLMAAARKPVPSQAAVSPEEKVALEQLRAELERQEASLKEAKQAQREREQFLDESETKLFEKVQAQQEKEIEQDQRAEDLRALERRLREREAALDPQAAAALKAADEAAAKRDKANE